MSDVTKNTLPKVAIVMGSKTDAEFMLEAKKIFDELEIFVEARIISAHRTPTETADYARSAQERGIAVIIAGAGAAAALPGTIAAHTLVPVIGVPLATTTLGGIDALLSICQMPGGVPVATMGIGKAGAKNAALFAARMLALQYPLIRERVVSYATRAYETAKAATGCDPFLRE